VALEQRKEIFGRALPTSAYRVRAFVRSSPLTTLESLQHRREEQVQELIVLGITAVQVIGNSK
jgi:hypothetical protein